MFIKRAAILYEQGGLFEGASYALITSLAKKLGITSDYILGYMDSNDTFVDGDKALQIAKEAGQIAPDFVGPMMPEDIFELGELENVID